MKKKFIIIVLMFAIVGFSTNAFADKSTPFTAITLDTNNDGFVDDIDVYITFTITDVQVNWANLTDDFEVGGYTSAVTVDGIDTGAFPNDNIFRVHIHSGVPNTIPTSTEDLLIEYTYDGTNQIVTTDPPSGGYLWSFPWMNVEDGAAPSLVSTTFVSDHQNTSLAIEGSIITVDFVSNEELLDFPTVKIYAVGGPTGDPINATMVGDRYHWTVDKEMTSLDNVSGLIKADFTIEDLNYNEDTKTDTSTIAYKTDPATEVYVDPTYTAQANVPAGKYWLWDCFEKIQEGIDGVTDPGTVIVLAGTGTYKEDLTINKTLEVRPYGTAKAYDDVTIKGEATVAAALWPLADPNIEITASGVSIHNFKIEAPDYVVGFYSSGIVIGATNVSIYLNDFYATSASNTDDICQSIQTYNGVDVSGLDIYTNTFTHKVYKWTADWGYEAIYINPGGTGLVNIEDNTLGGKLFRAITAQRSNCNIEANNISTDLNPVSDDWVTAGAWVGIWAYTDISDITITGNTVQGTIGGAGFNRGIRLGHTGGSTFTNLTVTSNEIYYNKNGIYSQSAAGITITGNAIVNNTAYGIFCDTGTLDAENNWWGSTNGPTHADNTFNVGSQGDVSSDYVDYVPWYDTNMTGTSFAPIEKDDGLKAITYFSSFQTAIDASSPGDEISAATGYFDEQFTVDIQNLTIQSMSGESATIQPTAAPVPAFYDVQVFASYTTLQDLVFDFGDRESVFTGIVVGEYGEAACPATVSNVTITNNELYSDGVAIQTGYTIDINDLLIDDNYFYLDSNAGTVDGAGGIYVSPFPDPPPKGGVTISYNWFEGYVDYGIAIDASNVTVTDNYIAGAGSTVRRAFIRYIDWYGNNNDNVVITYNEMADISRGIWVESHEGTGTLSGTIQYNYFTDCNEGILLADGLTTSLEITENDFVTTVFKGANFAVNNTTTVLADCENNWWDSVNGPTHAGNTFNVGSQGAYVTDYVDYVPWLDDEFDVGIPFAPVELWESSVKLDKNKLREENLSFKDVSKNGFEQFSSIQTAIDAYDDVTYDWAGIGCYAGTFTEDFVANKDDIWFEAEVTKQDVTLLGDQEVTGNYVWFDDFEFDPQAGVALLLNSSAAPIDGTWIYGCTFTIDESGDVGIYVGGSASPNAVTYTEIENSIFNGPTDMNSNPFKVGGWFGTNIGCEIDGLAFYNNEVNKGSIPINLVDEIVTDLYIGYNDFLNTDGAIYFWNNSGTPPTGELSYFDFSNNYVPSSNSYGIAIGGAALGGPIFTDTNFGLGNEINNNAFEMSGTTYGYGAVYMADQYTGLLDASNNWWGDQYGPVNDNNTYTPPAPPKGRATVSDRVEFAPWWNDGTDKYPTERGWYPNTGTTLFAPVINITQTSYHSSIQRAIDAATAADEISCLAGTFDECVTIDKNLTIQGAGISKAITYIKPSFAKIDAATVKTVNDPPVLSNKKFQSVVLVDYTGTSLTTIKDLKIDGSEFNTHDPTTGDYWAGIFFDGTAGTIDNIAIDDIKAVTSNRGVGVVVDDNSGTDKTTEIKNSSFNSCEGGTAWFVHSNAIGNIHHNIIDDSRNTIGFFSASSNTASIVDSNTVTNILRAVVAYPFNANVKADITNNTFDFSGIATATSVDGIYGNTNNITYSFELDIDNNEFIGNYPPGTKATNDSKPMYFIGNCTGSTITNNTFDDFYRGIFLDGGSSVVTNLAITNNVFTDIALNVISIEAGMVGVGTMAINYNSFDTNSAYAIWSVHSTTVDAQKNWYGDATGPDDDGDTNPHTTPLGAKVSTNVKFKPWYATSTVTPTTEYVRTHQSTKIPPPDTDLAFADIIQACIDAAADVYYFVQVTNGATPYTENLTVDNKAYIYGGGDKATPPVTIIGTHVITGDNVTFREFTLTPGAGIPGTVITINSASQIINNTDIEYCQFDIQTSPSIGVYVGGGTPTNAVINTEISGCTFNGPADMISNPFKVGGSFGSPVGCQIAGLYFIGNYVNYGSIPVNLADKDIVGLELYYNDFANTDGVIYFWAEDAIKSPTGEISDFWFNNNFVNDSNSYGVGFDVNGNFTSANYGLDIYIYDNYFGKNIPGAYGFDAVSILTPTAALAGYVLDATENWWGTADGPKHDSNTFNVPTQGAAVSDNVDFVRWYDSELIYADPGWIPTGSLFAPVVRDDGYKAIVGYYSSIQAGIDDASNNDEIICYAGTFTEDFSVPNTVTGLDINPREVVKGYDDVTIKGIATLEAAQFPNVDPNIDIWGANTEIHNFTIEAPDYVEGYYSSSVVIGAQNVTIADNDFIMNSVSSWDDVSQVIQTYATIDVSGLNISGNTFTHTVYKNGADYGYEAIYINSDAGTGTVTIIDNVLSGYIFRGITTERSYTTITGNSIITDLGILPDDWSAPGSWQGINVYNYAGDPQTDITVTGNTVKGIDDTKGFNQGLRIGKDGQTLTNVLVGEVLPKGLALGNTFNYNKYGILVKSASGVTINGNAIVDNTLYGIQNTDTGAKAILDAINNWWGDPTGPSFSFDYGLGSGLGDTVSTYVDYTPWYDTDMYGTSYYPTVTQFVMELNPTSPYQNNYFDIRIAAADTFGTRNQDYGNLADFSSSHAALTVPEEQLLVDGFKEVTNGCISSEAFAATDHLTIYSWEYNTNPPIYYSSLTDIVIQELNNPAPPTNVVFADNPGDNGGWILVDYTMSIDDPFYTVKDTAYGVSYYVVEIDTAIASGVPDWHFLANISCYDDGSGTNDRTALLPAPASDTLYNFRMASVYNPSKLGGFDENHISYEEIVLKDGGAQSTWQTGSAAPKDNLPAYADFTVFLEGPYASGCLMYTNLTTIPTVSPYDLEDIGTLPTVSGHSLVDWIQIQLRTTATGATEKTANAFLLEDGSIVDVNGNYSLPFYYTTDIDYYIVISHRNHLDIMTATGKAFGDTEGAATNIDISVAGSVYGNGFKEVETNVYAMYSGDGNGSGLVNAADALSILYNYNSVLYNDGDLNLSDLTNAADALEILGNLNKFTTVPDQAKGNQPEESVDPKVGEDCTLNIQDAHWIGSTYYFDVYITRNPSWTVSTGIGAGFGGLFPSTLVFNITASAFSSPSTSNYDPCIDGATSTILGNNRLSIELSGTGVAVPIVSSKLMTVSMTIEDPTATAGLSWRTGDCVIWKSDNSNEATAEYIGSDDSTLPVELSAFTALYNVEHENVILKWTTASETDVQGFNIYRSECDDIETVGNRINYSLISLPETGTTTNPIDYSYEDIVANVYSPYYYWLEVVDYGGTSSFHGSIVYTPGDITGDNTTDVYDATRLIGAYPNPAHNYTIIKYQLCGSVLEQNATIKVYNILGKCVKTVEGRIGKVEFDVSDLGSGIYFYQLKTSNYNIVKKLIVIR